MGSHRKWISVTAAVAICVSVTLAWQVATDRREADGNASVEAVGQPPLPMPSIPSVQDSSTASNERTLPALWREVDQRLVDVTPAYDDDWSETGRILVDVSGAVAASPTWRVGDRLAIDLPQLGKHHEPIIERIDDGLGHSRSVLGTIMGADGQRRRFVVTVGPKRVFAYIDTVEGPYELVAGTRLGWLLPSSSMMAGFDFDKVDDVVPERPDEIHREP